MDAPPKKGRHQSRRVETFYFGMADKRALENPRRILSAELNLGESQSEFKVISVSRICKSWMNDPKKKRKNELCRRTLTKEDLNFACSLILIMDCAVLFKKKVVMKVGAAHML